MIPINRNIITYHIFICLMVVAVSSCKGSENNPVNSTPPMTGIIPLKIGNSWNYIQTTFDTSGRVTQYSADTQKVVLDTLINGQKWFKYSSTGKHSWISNTDSGFVTILQFFPTGGYKSILNFKYPVSISDHYESGDLDVIITSMNSSIQVPAGTFTCIKYEFSYGRHLYDVYIHPGLGEIKRVSYFAFYPGYPTYSTKFKDSVSSIIELTSYQIH